MRFMFVIAFATLVAVGGPAMAVEEPRHDVLLKDGAFELRRYAPLIAAEVTVTGARSEAANDGFRLLADYIFGANAPQQKIAMTAPVEQRRPEGQKIAMTAPVTQAPTEEGAWVVRFIMPAQYTLATLPRPNNEAVRLREEPARQVAVVRFSGFAGADKLTQKETALREWMASRDLAPAAPATYAFYDPPWTLPWLRRNEIMIETE